MTDLSPAHQVAILGFVVGLIFGAVANKTNFCTMGAVSDWVNMGDTGRLRSWMLAIGVAILLSHGMQWLGWIELGQAIYLTPSFGWLGYLVGGVLFGIGMTLASGCGQRTLVRVGGGNLKSLVVMVFLGISAYMTMRGLLALVRVNVIEVPSVDLASLGAADQGMGTLLATAFGIDDATLVTRAVAVLLGGGLVVFAFLGASLRRSFNNVLAGFLVGAAVAAGWYITGVVGFDDFEPVRFESYTFVAPTAESLQYLMTFTGSTIGFGVAAVFGVIGGSLLYALVTGHFHVEHFVSRSDMIRHIIGAVLMGFGGVLALGCTVGQGITGLSTLALGSLLALVSIVFGSALAMKVEYYMLDEVGLPTALRHALADMRLFPAARAEP